jgi:hypothetical protein
VSVTVLTGDTGGRIATSTELGDADRLTAGRCHLGDDSSAPGAQKHADRYRYNLQLWPKYKQRSAVLTFVPFELCIVSLQNSELM